MVDRIRYPTVSYLPFYYVFFQFLLLIIFNLQANILTTKDILSNLGYIWITNMDLWLMYPYFAYIYKKVIIAVWVKRFMCLLLWYSILYIIIEIWFEFELYFVIRPLLVAISSVCEYSILYLTFFEVNYFYEWKFWFLFFS